MARRTPNRNNLDQLFKDFVPERLEGNDQYLDIVTWNIRFFNQREERRIHAVSNLMKEINADIFILQEIEEGSLDPVAQILTESGAGLYKTAYGTTGGDQRVAFVYDMEWVKASTPVTELFSNDRPKIGDKDVFPRLPLHAKFVAHTSDSTDPLDFEAVGVHLKSQRGGGGAQRTEAARYLASWLVQGRTDGDALIAGDWNAPADRPEWEAIRDLEERGLVHFRSWNANGEVSHTSRSGRGSRLDYILTTSDLARTAAEEGSTVIAFNELLDRAEFQQYFDIVSDHLPVVSRFYFTDPT